MISFDGETDCSVIYDLKRRENIAYNDVKFPSPIRARQGFTAVNPQSYDAGFWHSFCVQKKLFIPKTRVIIELNDVKFPSPIRARQGFTAVNPQSYDAGFWHSFCVQKKMIDPQNPSNN